VGTIGGGFAAGALLGYGVKQVMKIAAVIVGLLITVLAYLQFQEIIHVDWSKLQEVSQSGFTTAANTIMNISNNSGWSHTASTLSGLIPLTNDYTAE
jgi:uncharacterized membrane protein (Fun14 family)